MIDEGIARDLADLARQLGLTRAWVTQIVNYTLLALDIQEKILHLAPVERAKDQLSEHAVRVILRQPLWPEQRRRWRELAAPAT